MAGGNSGGLEVWGLGTLGIWDWGDRRHGRVSGMVGIWGGGNMGLGNLRVLGCGMRQEGLQGAGVIGRKARRTIGRQLVARILLLEEEGQGVSSLGRPES